MKIITYSLLNFLFILTTTQADLGLHKLLSLTKKSDAYTSASTAPVKNCTDKTKYKSLFSCFSKRSEANHAFQMIHTDKSGNYKRTKYVALLHHGLSDSPYFYRDIAIALFNQGINVIAPRWSGMGSRAEDLLFTKRSEWYEDIRYSKEIALEHGDKIIIAGMSLGGTIISHDLITNKDSNIAGTIFLSPAIGLMPKLTNACLVPMLYGAKKTYGTGVRYPKISNSATCQLKRIVDDILKEKFGKTYRPINVSKFNNGLNLDLNELYEDIDMPIFNVITAWDSAIDFQLSLGISTHSKSNEIGKSTLVYYYNPAEETPFPSVLAKDTIKIKAKKKLSHASTLLRNDRLLTDPEFNPYFDRLEQDLIKFIKKHFTH